MQKIVKFVLLTTFVLATSACHLFKKEPKQEEVKKEGAASLKEISEKYMLGHKEKPGVQVLSSGVQYLELESGAGKPVAENDKIVVRYVYYLANSKEIENTFDAQDPQLMEVNQQIPGLKEALLKAKEGTKFKAVIPSSLAYGEKGNDLVPPDAALIYELKVIEVNPKL